MAGSTESFFPLIITDDAITCRRPFAVRLWAVVWAVIMACCIYTFVHAMLKEISGAHAGALAVFVICASTLMYCSLLLLMLVTFLMLAGHYRVDCDLLQGTYEYRRGAPLPVKITKGQLTDFTAVVYRRNRVSSVYNPLTFSSYNEYRVYLVWGTAPRLWGLVAQPRLLMTIVNNEARAEAIAQELGTRLSLPVSRDRQQDDLEYASQEFLQKKNENEIVVCRPKIMRIVSGILAVVLGAGIITIGMLSAAPRMMGSTGDVTTRAIFAGVALGLLAPTLMFLLFSGPCLLHCDLRTRTYQFTRGFPFMAETTVGPLSDFRGVTYSGKSPWSAFVAAIVSYRVYLAWSKPPRFWGVLTQPRIMVDYSTTQPAVENQAITIGKLMDLPAQQVIGG